MSVLDKHLTHVTRGKAAEPVGTDRPPSPGRLSEKEIAANYKRLRHPVFATTDAQGRTTFVHDPGVIRDGILANTRTDKGEGVVSADAKEQPASVGPSRDASGKFTKAE